jgi:hypothetical protein
MQAPVSAEPGLKQVSYLDPTGHVYTVARQLSNRLADIQGTVAALLDNGNDTSRFFFDRLAEVLQAEYGVDRVILQTKFTSTKPADPERLSELAQEADFLVAGVAL